MAPSATHSSGNTSRDRVAEQQGRMKQVPLILFLTGCGFADPVDTQTAFFLVSTTADHGAA